MMSSVSSELLLCLRACVDLGGDVSAADGVSVVHSTETTLELDVAAATTSVTVKGVLIVGSSVFLAWTFVGDGFEAGAALCLACCMIGTRP